MATNAVQTARPSEVVKQEIALRAPEYRRALPSHIPVEKFTRVAETAILSNPDLMGADKASLFGAVVKLAQDGLLPDGREAALVIFNTKTKSGGWEKRVQAMPMIAGVLKKIRQSGEVAKVSAQVVYQNDHFVVSYGFDEDVQHNPPPLDKPRGKAIGAYATAVLKDGTRLLEVMSIEDIESVRNVSRAKDNGPWRDWWGEMARKTVMRRLSKRLPMSTDIEDDVFRRDETMTPPGGFETRVIEVDVIEPQSRMDALEHQIEDGEAEDVIETDEAAGEPAPPPAAQPKTVADRLNAMASPFEPADDETPAWQALVDDLKQRLASATTRKAVDADERDWVNNIRPFLPDGHEIIGEVERAIKAAADRVKG